MSARQVIAIVITTALFSSAASFVAAALVLRDGPRGAPGTPGTQGPPGPDGPEGSANISSADLLSAIQDDPDGVGQALSGHLDYSDIQGNFDPDPADVQSNLDDLCSQLTLSDALSNDVITC